MKHQIIIYTLLNDQTVLFHTFQLRIMGFNYCYVLETIQFNIKHVFTNSLMIKQFYFKQLSHLFALSLDINNAF